MRIVMAGGSGFIGSRLCAVLSAAGHQVTLLSRRRPEMPPLPGVAVERWDGRQAGTWADSVAAADAVINLSGESLAARRWTPRQKERIVGSRVASTRAIVEALGARRGGVLLNASAVGYYGPDPPGEVDERAPAGHGFLADTCVQWEAEAMRAVGYGVRVVFLRTGVVLGPDGGALERMLLPFRLFAGGPIGSGRQWFPWIHRTDAVGAILHALQTPALAGPLNLVAPEQMTMERFAQTLGRVLRRPAWLRIPALALRLALGEQAGMVLSGQRVAPAVLQATGYSFTFPRLDQALRDIC